MPQRRTEALLTEGQGMDAAPPKPTGAQPGNATGPWLGLCVASPAQSLLKRADRQTALAFGPLDCIAHSL